MKTSKFNFIAAIVIALFVLGFCGCSKSNDDPITGSNDDTMIDGNDDLITGNDYFIKFKVDGVHKKYDPLFLNGVYLNNISVAAFNEKNLGIVGLRDAKDNANKNSLTLVLTLIEENLKIQPNTEYNNMDIIYDENGLPSNMLMGLSYFDENGNECGSTRITEVKVNFTEITDSSVKGSFSAELINSSFNQIQITDGEFNAKNYQ